MIYSYILFKVVLIRVSMYHKTQKYYIARAKEFTLNVEYVQVY